jgi:hypothetical protein
MVIWTIFKNHLLEVGLTQNQETMALWMLAIVNLFYFIICEDHAWIEILEITFGWRPSHTWLHTTLEDMWPHYMILKAPWDDLWTLSFGLSQFHSHGSWLVCEVVMSPMLSTFILIGHLLVEANFTMNMWKQKYHHSNKFWKDLMVDLKLILWNWGI